MHSKTLQDSITHSFAADRRVVLLVGPPGCGKSRFLRELPDVSIVNVGKDLPRELIPIPEAERGEKAVAVLTELIANLAHPVVVLDNIGLLLNPRLNLDIWAVLDQLSAVKRLIVAWTGKVDGDKIQWGEPGVPGHLVMSLENCPASIVEMKV